MKKVIKRAFFIGALLCICTLVFFASYLTVMYATSEVKFDKTKITDSTLQIHLYDNKNTPLKHTFLKGEYISLNLLPSYVSDCFICIEDKEFYNHNGINLKRMVVAMAKNIVSFSFKEGASTISQQLIKNTHLTNEKTIKRKINEIKLTKELEETFTKDQILEYYLNVIYFGDNCYGIQNASEHYFSHSASKLTIDESAMLAGIIKSPNKYHPIKNYDKCIARRNLILNELKEDKKITEQEYINAKNTKTKIVNNTSINNENSYVWSAIQEAGEILKMPEKQIAIGEYRIYTYMDSEKQKALENSYDKNTDLDLSMISINSNNGGIEAYVEKADLHIINMKRQPASAIKPTLVYASAINENIISPTTPILDDDVTINGYTPKNIGNKKYGYVSATDALSKSLNIPAVKVLSYVGIDKAKAYLERQNIEFCEKDNNLAIALGGMTYGTTLKELTNTYQTLANKGNYIQAKFISHIVDKGGNVIYKNNNKQKSIYREDTAYLTTKMLQATVKTGTAKRLSDVNFEVASKTGTSSLSKNNIDAYNISYTTQDVVGCWVGKIDNSPIDVVGGGSPTVYVKNYLNKIYCNQKPKNFVMPSSVVEREIDLISLNEEHCVYLANDYLPERYREKAIFSRFYLPKHKYLKNISLSPPNITGCVKNGVATICFDANPQETYELYEIIDGNEILIDSLSGKKGNAEFCLSISNNQIHKYAIKSKITNYKTNTFIYSNLSNVISLYSTYV